MIRTLVLALAFAGAVVAAIIGVVGIWRGCDRGDGTQVALGVTAIVLAGLSVAIQWASITVTPLEWTP